MKISEMITDRYKLRIPPTVYYDLLADVQEVEEEQEPLIDKIRAKIEQSRYGLVNDKDFYASHGLDFDYKNMLEEYIKGVTKQAKIEVLTELQTEIEELPMYYDPLDISDLIQQKIDKLEGSADV